MTRNSFIYLMYQARIIIIIHCIYEPLKILCLMCVYINICVVCVWLRHNNTHYITCYLYLFISINVYHNTKKCDHTHKSTYRNLFIMQWHTHMYFFISFNLLMCILLLCTIRQSKLFTIVTVKIMIFKSRTTTSSTLPH